MKLRHVEVFYSTMLTGTVNGAARLLNVSQPAVTKVLMHAEDQLGFKLFSRIKGRIVPTREAMALFPEAERIFDALENIRILARNLKTRSADQVRVAAPPALCIDIVPSAVAQLQQVAPDLSFEIHTLHYAESIAAVLRQEVDFALIFNAGKHPALRSETLATANFVGCFPASHAARLDDSVTLETFQQLAFIGSSGRDPLGSSVRTAMQLANIDIAAQIEVKTNALALSFVERGAGATIVDEFTAATAGPAVIVRPLAVPITFEVAAVMLQDAAISGAMKRLLDIIAKAMTRR